MIRRILFSILLLAAVSITPALAQSEQARKTAAALLAEKKLPGLSVSVMKNGELIWSEGFGFADLENNVKATPKTKFRIGSISKLFTASALAKLHEKELIDFDDSVYKYVPSFPKKKNDITIRQLAGHLGGIRHYGANEYINLKSYKTINESLTIFQESPLKDVPGTNYSYSTYGFTLLSAAIEGASESEFLAFLKTDVLTPLNLSSTVPDENKKIVTGRSEFYSLGKEGEWVNAPYTDNSDRWAAGGLLSTSEDLVRFADAHLDDEFLRLDTRKVLFTPQSTRDGKSTGVGIAWRIGKDKKGLTIYHHGGSSIGGRAFLLIYPEKKLAIASATNLTFARFGANEVLEILRPFMQ